VRFVFLAAVGLALLASTTALAAADARNPSLRITDLSPLTVQGANFKPRERVKLLVNVGMPLSSAVRAGSRGRFVARLGVHVDVGACSAVVQAVGAAGSRALVDLARPGCDERP
jgi:hypothetical protein